MSSVLGSSSSSWSSRDGPADRERELPLAPPQYLLRFFETLYPGCAFGPRFTICAGFLLSGPLDLTALQHSVERVAQRHEALRTVVVDGGGVPWQKVLPPSGTARFTVDECPTPPDGQAAAVDAFLAHHEGREHATDDLPLLAAFLQRFSDDEAVLALVTHHSASDALSNQVLMRDIARAYALVVSGHPVDLPPPLQYGDYALDQQTPKALARRATALDYWARKLDGISPVGLPTDRPRPSSVSGRQGLLRFDLDDADTARIRDLGRSTRTTTFIILLAAYVVLFHQLTGAKDFAVPTLTTGRGRRETLDSVGFFLNAQLLRSPLEGDPTLAEVLSRVRTTGLEAMTHEVPVMQLIETVPDVALLLADERFVLLPFQLVPVSGDPAALGPQASYQAIVRRPETVRGMALPMDGLWSIRAHRQLLGNVAFSQDLFDDDTVSAMATGYLTVLRRMLGSPDTRLSEMARL